MSHEEKKLSVLAYANGFTLWHYRTEANKNAVLNTGGGELAFAHDIVRTGDVILVNAGNATLMTLVGANVSERSVPVTEI